MFAVYDPVREHYGHNTLLGKKLKSAGYPADGWVDLCARNRWEILLGKVNSR